MSRTNGYIEHHIGHPPRIAPQAQPARRAQHRNAVSAALDTFLSPSLK